jgi:hypothetical protein
MDSAFAHVKEERHFSEAFKAETQAALSRKYSSFGGDSASAIDEITASSDSDK